MRGRQRMPAYRYSAINMSIAQSLIPGDGIADVTPRYDATYLSPSTTNRSESVRLIE
jgi:hypothetical protein